MAQMGNMKYFLVSLCIAATAGTTCNSPWVSAGNNQNCFYITEVKQKYDQAKDSCNSIGGRIATFYQDEFEDFKQYIGTGDYWIGLELQGTCESGKCLDQWIWNDYTPTGDWVQNNWNWGEPDLGERTARLIHTKKWAGLYPSHDTGYICKKGVLPPQPTSTASPTATTSTQTTTVITTTPSTTTTKSTTVITSATTTTERTTSSTSETTKTTTTPLETSTTTTVAQAKIDTSTSANKKSPDHDLPIVDNNKITTSTAGTSGTTTALVPGELTDEPEMQVWIYVLVAVVVAVVVGVIVGVLCLIINRRNKGKDEKVDTYAHMDKSRVVEANYTDLQHKQKEIDSTTEYYEIGPITNSGCDNKGDDANKPITKLGCDDDSDYAKPNTNLGYDDDDDDAKTSGVESDGELSTTSCDPDHCDSMSNSMGSSKNFYTSS